MTAAPHPARSRSLGSIVARRITIFAVLAMVVQLVLVFVDCYLNENELSRQFLEQETDLLSAGLSGQGEDISYRLPDDAAERYGRPDSGYFARIRTDDGRVLFSSPDAGRAGHFLPIDLTPPTFWVRTLHPGRPLNLAGGRSVDFQGEEVLIEVVTLGDPDGVVFEVLWQEVIEQMIVPMGILLVLVLGGTTLSVRKALKPVHAAAQAAEALDPMDARSHLQTDGMPREVAMLAEAVNRAFGRVGDLIQSQRLLTSGIAHEVRTPLAAMKLELGRIDHPRARKAEADLDELVRFVGQMTSLARLDGFDHGAFRPERLDRLAEDVVETLAPWAYDRGHSLALEGHAAAPLPVAGSLIRDAIRNLVENAVKHTPEGTAITVRVEDGRVDVCDVRPPRAPGPESVPESRADTRAGDRMGIGLKIVERIAALHGGTFSFASTAEGSTASLYLRSSASENVPADREEGAQATYGPGYGARDVVHTGDLERNTFSS